MKISVVIPVYYNQDNLQPLYEDIKKKLFSHKEYEWEIIMVDDGSKDDSYMEMQRIRKNDRRVKIYSLSRNFGSHAAILCGLSKASGECVIVKAADLQEPTELVLEMIECWKSGNNVVLAVRKDRQEKRGQIFWANLYYWIVRKTSLPQMPQGGFDVYLLDKKVVNVLMALDEKNSALTGQILWSGFKTDYVYYVRLSREIGKSRWTLKKKIKLVMDTLFSFSTFPITLVSLIGTCSCIGAIIWALIVLVCKLAGSISVSGWTTLFIFNLLSFGIVMLTQGILGGYLWRTFDTSRNRPVYIVEREDAD